VAEDGTVTYSGGFVAPKNNFKIDEVKYEPIPLKMELKSIDYAGGVLVLFN
jgi:hypothetical protein